MGTGPRSVVRAAYATSIAVYSLLPPGDCGFYQAVVQVENTRAGLGHEVIEATFGAFRSLQRAVVLDTDVDLYDPVDVEWAITTRFDPDSDLVILGHQEGHVLNPVVHVNADGKGGTVTKIGMDAMAPFQGGQKFERVRVQNVDLANYDFGNA